MASTEQVVSTLNNLIETCRDGQEGFKTAAEGVNNAELKELFYSYSQQRAGFAGELQDEVRRFGGEPAEVGSVTASLHRGWMDIKAAVTGGEESSVLAECERGEDHAVEVFREAVAEPVSAEAASTIDSIATRILAVHNQVKELRDAVKAG